MGRESDLLRLSAVCRASHPAAGNKVLRGQPVPPGPLSMSLNLWWQQKLSSDTGRTAVMDRPAASGSIFQLTEESLCGCGTVVDLGQNWGPSEDQQTSFRPGTAGSDKTWLTIQNLGFHDVSRFPSFSFHDLLMILFLDFCCLFIYFLFSPVLNTLIRTFGSCVKNHLLLYFSSL